MKNIIRLILGVMLLTAATVPQTAQAQINQSCCTSIVQQLNSIKQAIDNLNVANNKGQQTTAEQDQRIADYNSKTLSELLKQKAKTDAFLDYQEPNDYQCAAATLAQGEAGRVVGSQDMLDKVDKALAQLYTDNESGNPIYQKRFFNAICKLGAVGNGETDRFGNACDTAADETLRGVDISLGRAIIDDACIPFDADKIVPEFTKAMTTDNYTPAVPQELKKGLLIMLLMHNYVSVTQDRFIKNDAAKTSQSLDQNIELGILTAQRLSNLVPVSKALAYHSCMSTSVAKGCDAGDREATQYLNDEKLIPPMKLPPGGYCLSQLQRDLAKSIMNKNEMKNYRPGADVLTAIKAGTLQTANDSYDSKRNAIDGAAANALKLLDNRQMAAVRPVQSMNAPAQDLVAAIRKLTKVLESRGMSIEIPQPVREVRPANPATGPSSQNGQDTMLQGSPALNAAGLVAPAQGTQSAVSATTLDVLPPITRTYPVLGR